MKSFIIGSGALKTALHKLSPAIVKNPVIAILSNLLVRVEDKKIELTASDGEIIIQYRTEAETAGEAFEFLVSYQLIAKIVSISQNIPMTFSMERKGVKITGVNDVYEVKTLPALEEFPKITQVSQKQSTSVDWQVIQCLGRAQESAGKDDVNFAKFTNVLLELRKDKMTVASTDGQFMLFNYEFPIGSPEEDDLLLRPKVIKAIDGMLTATLAWNQKKYSFSNETITVIVNKQQERYPNFRTIIPADFDSNLTVDRHDLVSALEKCSINTDPFKKTKIDLAEKGKVKFLAHDDSLNININVSLEAEYGGPVESLHVNAEKMLKVLGQADYDKIDLAIHAANRAVIFRSKDDEAYLGLIIPTYTKTNQ